jgi:TPR repeat protein
MKAVPRLSAALLFSLLLAPAIGADAQNYPPRGIAEYADLVTVRDDATVRRLMRRQAETGDSKAMLEYAKFLRSMMFADSDESQRAHAEAERFDRMAAEGGDPVGQVNAGVWCLRNQRIRTLPGACHDDAEAVRWFRLAMDGGNATAVAYYGYMVEFGRGGLAKDPKAAAHYYAQAGKLGDYHGGRFLSDMTEYADRQPRGPNP